MALEYFKIGGEIIFVFARRERHITPERAAIRRICKPREISTYGFAQPLDSIKIGLTSVEQSIATL